MSDGAQDARPSFGVARFAEETRERFVREIVARVPLARVVELHLFAPLRQGGMESGVAVLAAQLEVQDDGAMPEPAAAGDVRAGDALVVEPAEEVVLADEDSDAAAGPPPAAPAAEVADQPPAPASPPRRLRHTIFTARYRLVLKGPERGRWDVEVREEADAPLITVEAVVRGVQARAGDAGDPERLDGAMVARILGVTGDAG